MIASTSALVYDFFTGTGEPPAVVVVTFAVVVVTFTVVGGAAVVGAAVVGAAVVGAEALAGRQMMPPGKRAVLAVALLAASSSLVLTLTFLAMRIQ